MSKNNIIFNKIFEGSYLIYNLGHELINFMKLDNGDRFIYLNPYGKHSKDNSSNSKYVFHVMEVNFGGKKYLELIAISEIDHTKTKDFYGNSSIETRNNIKNKNITFKGHNLVDIFEDVNSYLCSFVAKDFLLPKNNIRVLFRVTPDNNKVDIQVEKENKTIINDGKTIYIYTLANKKWRNISYSKEEDDEYLNGLLKCFESKKNDSIELPKDTEQCLSVICDRTKLECSTSNQIAYYFNRDRELMKKFIKYLVPTIPINSNTKFRIYREWNKIDLLILVTNGTNDYSNEYVIVVENKIDSGINGVKDDNTDAKLESQLSKYYNYICHSDNTQNNKLEEEFKLIPNKHKYFFILEPEYSSITQSELEKYVNGDKYKIISYKEFYDEVLNKHEEYKPVDGNNNNKEHRKFLFNEFKKTIKYINSSKADLMKEITYIRLKQRIEELNNMNNNV